MANYTSAQLLAVISAVKPVFNSLRFYQYPQNPKQRLYPSVDIKEIQPQSPSQGVQLIDYRTRFEINIFIKWANRTQDTNNLELLERNIVNAIRATTLTTGKLILESNDFLRDAIKENPLNVDGVQSQLVLYFDERAAVTGIIGLQQSLDIGSITGLQILGETGGKGMDDKRRMNDRGFTKISPGERLHNTFWEYPYTQANYAIIDGLIQADNIITVTLHEQTQSDTVLEGKPVYQRWNVRYDGQKVAILQFEVDDYSDS